MEKILLTTKTGKRNQILALITAREKHRLEVIKMIRTIILERWQSWPSEQKRSEQKNKNIAITITNALTRTKVLRTIKMMRKILAIRTKISGRKKEKRK